MALKTFVKVGDITNLSDARYCAGMEVDLLGFRFDPGSGIDPKTFSEITGWLSGVRYVAEFQTTEPNDILRVLGQSEVDFVQIRDKRWISELSSVKPVILEVDLKDLNGIPAHLPIEYVIVSGDGEDLTEKDREVIEKMSDRYKLLLGTGFNSENVEQLVRELRLKGIAMKGSEEIRPGYKDYDELADILEALETEN